MKGKWSVTSNIIGGNRMYAVYRVRDIRGADHSGNRELATRYVDDRLICERIVEYLNDDPNGDLYNTEGLTLEQRQRMTVLVHDYRVGGGRYA